MVHISRLPLAGDANATAPLRRTKPKKRPTRQHGAKIKKRTDKEKRNP